MFRHHEGFSIKVDEGIRRPKGIPKKRHTHVDRKPLMTSGSVDERYLWLQAGGK